MDKNIHFTLYFVYSPINFENRYIESRKMEPYARYNIKLFPSINRHGKITFAFLISIELKNTHCRNKYYNEHFQLS